MRNEIYFSVDVEADGPIPGPYSMVSVGVAVAGRRGDTFVPADPAAETFYRELRPISDEYLPAALEVSGLDRARLVAEGADPATAMRDLVAWIGGICGDSTRLVGSADAVRLVGSAAAADAARLVGSADAARPVMVAYPASFDWMFLYWYLIRFTGGSPFGHSGCLDLKTMYAVKADVPLRMAVKRLMPARLLSTRRHTHHALDDAMEQADLFVNLMGWSGPDRT